MTDNAAEIKSRITNIDKTDENLTGRSGLLFISRYLRATKVTELLAEKFHYFKKELKRSKFVFGISSNIDLLHKWRKFSPNSF